MQRENLRDLKDIPSALIDEAIFGELESGREETKESWPEKIGRKETVTYKCEKEKAQILCGYNPLFFEQEKFKKVNLEGINSNEFIQVISRQ